MNQLLDVVRSFARKYPIGSTLVLCGIISIVFFPDIVLAHEKWFLTPEQEAFWRAQPKPSLFTSLSWLNVSFLTIAFTFLFGWVLLGRTGARELFPDLQVRLASYGAWASVILRITTAIMLIMAAFGLSPRSGVAMFSSPTLIAPDLQLNLLSCDWLWLKWVEFFVAVGLIAGIYVRFIAFLLGLVTLLGLFLFSPFTCDVRYAKNCGLVSESTPE